MGVWRVVRHAPGRPDSPSPALYLDQGSPKIQGIEDSACLRQMVPFWEPPEMEVVLGSSPRGDEVVHQSIHTQDDFP
eukprot:1150564-Pelagomonas_calceolata.AAC.1